MLCMVRVSTSHRVTSLLRCIQHKKPNNTHYSTQSPTGHQQLLRRALLQQARGRYGRRTNYCATLGNTTPSTTDFIISSSCCNRGIIIRKTIHTSSPWIDLNNPERAMDLLSVINVPEDDKLKITFDYCHNGTSRRNFNLVRPKDEPLGQSLFRLKANLSKFISKKTKKKKRKLKTTTDTTGEGEAKSKDDDVSNTEEDEEGIEISVWKEHLKIPETVPNVEAWVTGSSLRIDSSSYNIIVNIPTITKLVIPTNIMVGYPVYLQIDYLFTDVNQCDFSWYKDIKKSESTGSSGEPRNTSNNGKTVESTVSWEKLSSTYTNPVYTPTVEDLGHMLKVVCLPRNDVRDIIGKEISTQSSVVVDAGPGHCPFQTRHLFTRDLTQVDCFRVVSYNLLADLYADSDYSRTMLYPYCPPYALTIDYRKQLILKEISGYNADLICLQEVDRKIFENDLLPALSLSGFDGVLRTKAGQVPEGCATFFRKSKFKLISQHDLFIMEAIQTDPRFQDILQLLETNEDLKQRILNRQTVLQLSVLESMEKEGHFLCAANIHLYFHPTAKSIRLLQIAVSMRQIDSVMKIYKDQGKEMTLTFCGDFNSSPDLGVNQFLTTGYIPADFEEWKAAGNPDGVETGIPLSHSLNLTNGCGTPEYTNYVAGFNAQLDYIYHDPKKLEVQEVVPPPEHEQVTLQTALPSVVFPSDHIAQICTFKWT